jgi:hypothetical protein
MGFVRSTNTHTCPCGCGVQVPNNLYACRIGWYRLPKEIRNSIWATAKLGLLHPDRREVLEAAREWYRDNPGPAKAATS